MSNPAPSNPSSNPPAPAPGSNPTPPAPDPNNPVPGADPNPNPDPNNQPVQLTQEQLAAAFQHPRFKELTAQAAKAKELEEAQKKAEEERAKQNGEFEKLAEANKAEAEKWKAQYQSSTTNNAIMAAAVKAGISDPDAAVKLIERGGIKLNDDGTVEGVDDAVKQLIESKPYLKGTAPAVNSGGGPANPDPNGTGTPPAFTGSQVKDHKFYMEHQAEIDKAVDEGRVDWTK